MGLRHETPYDNDDDDDDDDDDEYETGHKVQTSKSFGSISSSIRTCTHEAS